MALITAAKTPPAKPIQALSTITRSAVACWLAIRQKYRVTHRARHQAVRSWPDGDL